jgi:hypothetical protein
MRDVINGTIIMTPEGVGSIDAQRDAKVSTDWETKHGWALGGFKTKPR